MAREAEAAGASARAEPLRYVETSLLLAALLEQDAAARRALRRAGRRVTSVVTVIEARRALVRTRASGRIDAHQQRDATRALETFVRRCDVVALADDVLLRAGRPFPVEPVRTLDALHLGTLEFLGLPPPLITVLSADTRIRSNAAAMGYAVE